MSYITNFQIRQIKFTSLINFDKFKCFKNRFLFEKIIIIKRLSFSRLFRIIKTSYFFLKIDEIFNKRDVIVNKRNIIDSFFIDVFDRFFFENFRLFDSLFNCNDFFFEFFKFCIQRVVIRVDIIQFFLLFCEIVYEFVILFENFQQAISIVT